MTRKKTPLESIKRDTKALEKNVAEMALYCAMW